MLGTLLKIIIVVALLAFVGLAGFAYLGDLTPDQTETTVPVVIDG